MEPTLEQVLNFIAHSSLSDLDQIEAAIGPRRERALQEWRDNLVEGEAVMLIDIRPAVFRGLTGIIVGKTPNKRSRYTVRLDKRSTQTLRYCGDPRVRVPANVEEHEIAVLTGCLAPYQT